MVKKRLTDGLTLISVNNTGIKSAGVACRGLAVPADAGLIDCDDLTVNEAPLTGDALPVLKDAKRLLPP